MLIAPDVIEVWTDGACSGAPGIGGWAWATLDGRAAWGFHPRTTSQRMEMTAALRVALDLPEDEACIVSDSAYVVNCFRDRWYLRWQQQSRGGTWYTSQKTPVANQDLWVLLIEAVLIRGITFRKVRGHAGDPMNERVDRLAVKAKFEQQAGVTSQLSSSMHETS